MTSHAPPPSTGQAPSRSTLLRQCLAGGTIAIPGTPIALVAKLAEQQGFEAIYLSGAALSAGLLGVPDIGIVTLEQLIEHTRVLAGAVQIPLIVDADTGFGGPREVSDCVRALEEAGAAGIQLEDQRRDKRCGHLPGKEIIDSSSMCRGRPPRSCHRHYRQERLPWREQS